MVGLLNTKYGAVLTGAPTPTVNQPAAPKTTAPSPMPSQASSLTGAAKLSVQNAAARYSGGDIRAFEANNPDMYRNLVKDAQDGKTIIGADGVENWNMNHSMAPGSALPFKSGVGTPTMKPVTEALSKEWWDATMSGKDMSGYRVNDWDGNNNAADSPWNQFADAPRGSSPGASVGAPGQAASAAGSSATVSGVPYTNVGSNRRNDSVMERVNEITAQDSPLMQQAMTAGMKFGNSRGLLNSSMAGQAAQEAALNVALPIASQDAAQAMQTNLADANRELDLIMQANQISLADRQQLRSIASAEGMAAADRALQDLLSNRQIGFQTEQNRADRYLQDLLKQRDILYGSEQAALNRSLEADLAKLNLNQAAKQFALGNMTNLEAIRADKIANINANTNLDAETRAQMIATAQKEFDDGWNFIKNLASTSVEY